MRLNIQSQFETETKDKNKRKDIKRSSHFTLFMRGISEKQYNQAVQSLQKRIQRLKKQLLEQQTTPQEMKTEEFFEEPMREEEPVSNPSNSIKQREEASSRVETRQEIQIFMSKKDQIKHYIQQLLRERQRSTIGLKTQLVDQERLCSKASFYRYMEELRTERKIQIIEKEKKEYNVLISL